jgi:nitrogenase molybdenum-iron protein NifN
MGLDACDRFTALLSELAGHKVPDRIERQRAQLQDAMVDTHFMTGLRRVGLAADPDLLHQLATWLAGMGSEIVAAVAPVKAPVLSDVPAPCVHVGDLEDLEDLARANGAEILLGNSHVAATAARLDLPMLRAGMPQYDLIGGHCKTWVGYRGTRQALFDLANLVVHNHEHITPYHARLTVRDDTRTAQPTATAGIRR